MQFHVGTSGYSFRDWVGPFYPPGTQSREMFAHYLQHFDTVEINYTYYRMPTAATMARLTAQSPPDFRFWVKAFGDITHAGDRQAVPEYLDQLAPMRDAGKLAGVLCQFPQSFHRTPENRRYLAGLANDFAGTPLAIEFRHASWDTPDTFAGLRDFGIIHVVPDVPPIRSLYPPHPRASTSTGYLRLHSRNADKWYSGAERYDYDYSEDELREILQQWATFDDRVEQVYTFFNNCHGGQAARNAEAFRQLLDRLDTA